MLLSSRKLLLISVCIMLGGVAGSAFLFVRLKGSEKAHALSELNRFCRRKSAETFQQFEGGATILQALQQSVMELSNSEYMTDRQWHQKSSQLLQRSSWKLSALSNLRIFSSRSAAVAWGRSTGINIHPPVAATIGNITSNSSAWVNGRGLIVANTYSREDTSLFKGVDYFQSQVTIDIVRGAFERQDLTLSQPFENPDSHTNGVLLFFPILQNSTLVGGVSALFRGTLIVVDQAESPEVLYSVKVNGQELYKDKQFPLSQTSNYEFRIANVKIDFACTTNTQRAATPFIILALGSVLSLLLPLAALQYRHQLNTITHENLARLKAEQDASTARVGEVAAVEAANLKSAFLANVSHELRTPLNGICGNIDFMLDSNLTDEQTTYASVIKKSSETLVGIIDDILDYTQFDNEEHQKYVNLVPICISELLDPLPTIFADDLQKQHDRLFVVYQRDYIDSLTVLCDSRRVRRVIHKLVNNAIKFTKNGTVTVRASFPLVINSDDVRKDLNKDITFEVIDTGCGIPTDLSLFEPFTQEDNRRARRYGGTGMGLAISKRLVESMGGHIAYESDTHGTCFRFTVPYLEAPVNIESQGERQQQVIIQIQSPSPERPAFPRQSHKEIGNGHEKGIEPENGQVVLVVDDNAINVSVAKKTLEKLGFASITASNGQEAVNLANDNRKLVAILMDISMPVMDGLEATKIIRQDGCTLPIIAMTANALDSERDKCIEVGMNAFLTKPLSRQKLQETLSLFI